MLRLLTFTILLATFTANAQSTAWERCNDLGKGANLSNWLEAGWLGNDYPDLTHYAKPDLVKMQQFGIRTIRLPVIFEWLADTPAALRTPSFPRHLRPHRFRNCMDATIGHEPHFGQPSWQGTQRCEL